MADEEGEVELNKEEFQKLLRIVTELRATNVLDLQGRLSLPSLAKEGLKSSFWSWPADAQGLDTSSDIAWCRGLVQRKLVRDAKRVRRRASEMHNYIVSAKTKAAASMESIGEAKFEEERVASAVRRYATIQALKQQLEAYVMDTFTAAASILYDFDVVLSPPGSMPMVSTGTVMPVIVDMFGIAYNEGLGAFAERGARRNSGRSRSRTPNADSDTRPSSARTGLRIPSKQLALEPGARRPSKRMTAAGFKALPLPASTNQTGLVREDSGSGSAEFPSLGVPIIEVVEVTDDGHVQEPQTPANVEEMESFSDSECPESEGTPETVTTQPSIAKRCLSTCGRWMVPPIHTAVRELHYNRSSFQSDLMASVIISAAGIPKAMSYAALTGLPVAAGITTMYVPCVVYALLGHSRQGAISPQSVPCLLLAALVEEEMQGSGFEADAQERAVVTLFYTFITGVVMLAMGLLQLSFLLQFISKPVLSGFVSASSLIAAASTAKSLLGIKLKKSPLLHKTIAYIVEGLSGIHWATAAMSASFIIMYLLYGQLKGFAKRRSKKSRRWKTCARVLEVPSVVPIVLFGAFLGAILCDFTPFTKWVPVHLVLGAGSSSTALIYNAAGEAFNESKYHDRKIVSYSATGSGDGLRQVMATEPSVDFGSSDVRPSDAELWRANISATFPVVSTWICPIANVPMVRTSHQISLVMDLPTLAGIFDGSITHWSDPSIQRLNPNLPWSGVTQRITVVTRAGRSGTTYHFAGALSVVSANITASMSPTWGAPSQMAVQSNKAVVRTVESNTWSIGYATVSEVVSSSAASEAGCVAIKTSQGIMTVQLAEQSGGSLQWPIQQTAHVLVPSVPVVARGGVPRQGFCAARSMLYEYLEMVFQGSLNTVPVGMRVLPRPSGLDSILCPGRRLARSAANTATCCTIKMVGYVEPSLPSFSVPITKVPLDIAAVVTKCLMLAIVILLEHVAIVKHYSEKHSHDVSISADLVAVGLANIVGSFSGSFIVACGLSRSALNSSAVSQISLLLSAVVSLAIVYAVAPVISMLPDPVLGVVLFMAVIHMVDIPMIKRLCRLRARGVLDLVMLTVAFISTCVLGVVQGMVTAVAFSLIIFIFNSTYPQIAELRRKDGSATFSFAKSYDGVTELASRLFPAKNEQQESGPLLVLRFEAPLWFANVGRLCDVVMPKLRSGTLKTLVLEMSTVPWMDTSAAVEFDKLLQTAQDEGVEVSLVAASQVVQDMLTGMCGETVSDKFFDSVYEAALPRKHMAWHLPTRDAMGDP